MSQPLCDKGSAARPPRRARRAVGTTSTEKSDLMTEAETAHLLHVAPKTLSNQRGRREGLPYIRLSSGAIRYSRQAVEAWLKKRTVVHGEAV